MERQLTPGTLFRFLEGDREAILTIASHPASLWIGSGLVISAGLARNYDQEDLLHEPWHVLVGAAAAIGISLLLFALVYRSAKRKKKPLPRFLHGYRAFLGLFLCMAPMAWLYAIPYERMLRPYDAAVANLWTLAIVSTWRVLLTSRVLGVLFSTSPLGMFFVVMLFADSAALLAPLVIETPIFDLMGGIRNSPVESLHGSVTFLVQVFGFLSLPVWILAAGGVLLGFGPSWFRSDPLPVTAPSSGLKALVAASVLAWIPVLPFTQPEQLLRRRAERLLRSGHVEAAAAEMSRHERADYPLHWDPPPRPAYRQRNPDALALCQALESPAIAEWVRELFLEKIDREVRRGHFHELTWSEVARIFREHDFGDLKREAVVECILKHDRHLTAEDREALESLLSARSEQGTEGSSPTDPPERQ